VGRNDERDWNGQFKHIFGQLGSLRMEYRSTFHLYSFSLQIRIQHIAKADPKWYKHFYKIYATILNYSSIHSKVATQVVHQDKQPSRVKTYILSYSSFYPKCKLPSRMRTIYTFDIPLCNCIVSILW
jgi:hypothetical protein